MDSHLAAWGRADPTGDGMADVLETGDGESSTPWRALTETRRSISAVLRNRNLRRIELAYAGSAIGDWAYATAVAVWAYGEGGAKTVGIWMAVRYTLMALSAPFSAALADRMPRKQLMLLSDLARAVLISAAAACLFLDTPAAPVFVLATLAALLATPFLVAQRSILPSLADRPEELTAANGTASTIEALAFFAGPALAAVVLGFSTVEAVFLVNVATFVWSMAMVLGVKVPATSSQPTRPEESASEDHASEDAEPEPAAGFLVEAGAGFKAIAADRGLTLVTVSACAQTVVAGASMVIVLVMADTILDTGASGVGVLNSVLGVGSIVGGLVALARASRERLGTDLTAGVLLWSAPLLLVSVWPSSATCFLAMALLGLGNPLVDVNLDTIIQRRAPDEVLGRVFGALEACFIATMALGALLIPWLIDVMGLRSSLLVLSGPVVLIALATAPAMRRLEGSLLRPANLSLLSRVDIFAPLAPTALESLARGAEQRRFAAGDVLVREGEESDLFFVIESGLVEVTQGDRVLRREGPGEYFGEIGLLRDVARTATITAVEDTVVQAIGRDEFLTAVTGQREARLAAESIASRRLAV